MSFIVISMFTPNTIYVEEANKLRESLVKHDLKHHIYEIEDTGSWEKNCQQKAICLRRAFDEYPDDNIVWVDADAIIFEYPKFFDDTNSDCSWFVFNNGTVRELASGTLFFRNNTICRKLVDSWIKLNSSNMEWDQRNLKAVAQELTGQYKYTELPSSYCKIKDRPCQLKEPDIIVHYMASRRVTNKRR